MNALGSPEVRPVAEGFAPLALKGLLSSVDHIVVDQGWALTKHFPHSLHSDGFSPV